MNKAAEEGIRQTIRRAMEDGVTAGASVLVMKDGKEALYLEEGFADREQQKPIRRDTIFRLYSMSKPITAAAAMILMERGLIDLEEPVAAYLPEFADQYIEKDGCFTKVGEPMKLIHLLNMTSGLTYGGENPGPERKTQALLNEYCRKVHSEDAVTTREFAGRLGKIPLLFQPGRGWRYSLSADVLGAVIEAASGMRFGEFLEKELFAPLGMKDTGFWVPESRQDRLVSAYGSDGHGGMEPYTGDHLIINYRMDCPPAFESGGAGLVSTIDDYSRFAQMLLGKGELDGVRVLSEKTVEYMTSGGLNQWEKQAFESEFGLFLPGYTYSHLMRIMQDPGRASVIGSRGEYGWDGWLGCYFANLPERNMTILLMQQKKDAGTIPMTRKIRNIICSEKD